jgi:2-oxoisovalerate dehydrogenase E1 component beta subunit
MPRRTMIEAIRDAMDVMMGHDDNVVVFGQDVGFFGGVFRCTQGLQAKYGKSRCFDAPINESGIVGAAVGMAAYGLRPCVEIQFADYMYPAYDQIVSEAARLRYRSNGQFTCPLVVRMPTGGGISGGQTHSQSPEALFTHVAGLKDGRAVYAGGRQRAADRGNRRSRSSDFSGTEAAVQRPV